MGTSALHLLLRQIPPGPGKGLPYIGKKLRQYIYQLLMTCTQTTQRVNCMDALFYWSSQWYKSAWVLKLICLEPYIFNFTKILGLCKLLVHCMGAKSFHIILVRTLLLVCRQLPPCCCALTFLCAHSSLVYLSLFL